MARPTRCGTCPDCVHPHEQIWCEGWGDPELWVSIRLRARDGLDLTKALADVEAHPSMFSLAEIAVLAGRAGRWISGA